jgi:hypothetical protein
VSQWSVWKVPDYQSVISTDISIQSIWTGTMEHWIDHAQDDSCCRWQLPTLHKRKSTVTHWEKHKNKSVCLAGRIHILGEFSPEICVINGSDLIIIKKLIYQNLFLNFFTTVLIKTNCSNLSKELYREKNLSKQITPLTPSEYPRISNNQSHATYPIILTYIVKCFKG